MNPWDLIPWAFAVAATIIIVGLPLALVTLLITIARGKI